MKGCVVMVSCSEQIKTLSQILKEEIEEFDKLSKDEAKKKAQEDLKEIGFLDDQGERNRTIYRIKTGMYSKKMSMVIGFHGCDISVRDAVILLLGI